MGFFGHLNRFDTNLLLGLNNNYTDFWDRVMYMATDKIFWIPLFVLILYMIIKNKGRESLLIIGMLILTVVFDDTISTLIKHTVERLRPTHDPRTMFDLHVVNGYRGGLYGFVSSHAANSFGIALFLALLVRNIGFSITIFLWAAFHSYTRIYLGVHYPFDILGGIVLGLVIGWACFKMYAFLRNRFHFLQTIGSDLHRLSHSKGGFDRASILLSIFMFVFSLVFLVIMSSKMLNYMS